MKMMTCKEASRLSSEGQDRPLKLMEYWDLKLHLWMCDNCRQFERQMEFLRTALRLLGEELETLSQGPNLPSEAKVRIRKVLQEQDRI